MQKFDQTARGRQIYAVATNYLDEEDRFTAQEIPWRLTFGLAMNNTGSLRVIGGVNGGVTNDTEGVIEFDGQNLNLALRYLRGSSDGRPKGWAADLGLLQAFTSGGNNLYLGIGYRTYSD